jgi:hypothetical protein
MMPTKQAKAAGGAYVLRIRRRGPIVMGVVRTPVLALGSPMIIFACPGWVRRCLGTKSATGA